MATVHPTRRGRARAADSARHTRTHIKWWRILSPPMAWHPHTHPAGRRDMRRRVSQVLATVRRVARTTKSGNAWCNDLMREKNTRRCPSAGMCPHKALPRRRSHPCNSCTALPRSKRRWIALCKSPDTENLRGSPRTDCKASPMRLRHLLRIHSR